MWLPVVLAALALGFLAGLLTFRRADRWVPSLRGRRSLPGVPDPSHPEWGPAGHRR
jgi:hypothetical protein